MTQDKSAAPNSRKAKREQTRIRILDAVLDIVVAEGMRAVRHRAVAEKAGVSLGSTTYHFASIEELIISAFEHWRGQRELVENPFYLRMLKLLQPFGDSSVPSAQRQALAEEVYELSVQYLHDQLTTRRLDRRVELAFYHEAMRYHDLRDLVVNAWEGQLAFLAEVHRLMGSPVPSEDARITSHLFFQIEQAAMMSDDKAVDVDTIRRTLHRHMTLCFGVDISNGINQTQTS